MSLSRPKEHGAEPSKAQVVYRRDPVTGEMVEGLLIWGLIPHDADRRPDFRPIHARAETIHEQRMFRDAFRKRRCIAPMNAFFRKTKLESAMRFRETTVSRLASPEFGRTG